VPERHAYVVTDSGDDRRRFPVGSRLLVGRDVGCQLVVRDLSASRRHLEICAENGGFWCRDLSSRNGTRVNGEPISEQELTDGDEIRLGNTVLRFELAAEAAARPPEPTVFLQTVIDRAGKEQEPPSSSRSKELLEAAYTLMNAMSSTFDECELVDTILQTTMGAVGAQRGAVLFAGPDRQLEPCPVCGRVHTIRDGVSRPADIDDFNLSESVATRVLRNGENVLIRSARSDRPIDTSVSIAALNLTSILCVPIRTRDEVLGILYIDTDLANHEYTEDDMLLAAAAGNSAGLALENARIHADLLEKQRMDQDIHAAWTIQEGFLVRDWPVDDPRIDVYGVTRPARIVGGDFYDFAWLDDDHVGMLIGDVSGKGVPAALTMALLLAEFRLCATGAESTAEVMRRLNERMVARSRRGTFCTAALVALNVTTGRMMGANAGHHPVLRVSGNGADTFLPASGPPLGILSGADWSDEEWLVEPGQTLLLYTDGIVEARKNDASENEAGAIREYGIEGLEAVARRNSGATPQELIEAVLDDVESFCRPLAPHDDCTMIALTFHGNG
jgi:sigma-B regulation protein RsbU (phosphoserine phosphatase)